MHNLPLLYLSTDSSEADEHSTAQVIVHEAQ